MEAKCWHRFSLSARDNRWRKIARCTLHPQRSFECDEDQTQSPELSQSTGKNVRENDKARTLWGLGIAILSDFKPFNPKTPTRKRKAMNPRLEESLLAELRQFVNAFQWTANQRLCTSFLDCRHYSPRLYRGKDGGLAVQRKEFLVCVNRNPLTNTQQPTFLTETLAPQSLSGPKLCDEQQRSNCYRKIQG